MTRSHTIVLSSQEVLALARLLDAARQGRPLEHLTRRADLACRVVFSVAGDVVSAEREQQREMRDRLPRKRKGNN